MMAGFQACYFCIKAFSETDHTEDLEEVRRADADPARRRRPDRADCRLGDAFGQDGQERTLKVYKGAPHGMCTTHKDQVNEICWHS